MRTLCDLQGREAGLGRCLGRGGEGAVYSVPMWPRLVAKIYARRPDDHASRKLAAMVQLGTDVLAEFAAWPQNLLLDPPTGDVVGFLMPRVDDHREIHALYGPTDRKTAFPDASWQFLVHAARNVAAAVDAVHQHDHVIGDINQGNVVVSRRATVRLIDCDSFQITHLGRNYPCRVGVPLYTPPELQGQRLEHVVRTAEHDRFGLAVLVFQLLFMGRHPFAGRHPDRALAVEAAIREGLFAFGHEAARQGWQPPPHSLCLKDVSPRIAYLFEQAFGREAAHGAPRPAASAWVESLDELEGRLAICGDDPRHSYAGAGGPCPWCRIENEGGPSFFFLAPGAAPDAFDLAATWRAIEAVRSPGPLPPLPSPQKKGGVEGFSTLVMRTLRGLAARVVEGEGWYSWESERRTGGIAVASANLRRLEVQWEELCGSGPFQKKRRRLQEARAAFEQLAAVERDEWEELAARFRDKRLQPHLQTFALEFARIPGLGPAEIARLASRGVRTAADLTPEALMSIPSIDLGLVRGLLLFKGVATRSFEFDPVTGIPGRDRKALADRQAERKGALLKTLQDGAVELAEVRRQTLAWRETLGHAIANTHRELADLREGFGFALPRG